MHYVSEYPDREPHTCMLLFLLQNHSDLQLFLTVRVRRSITQCKQMAPRLSLIKDKLWVKQSSCCSVVLISWNGYQAVTREIGHNLSAHERERERGKHSSCQYAANRCLFSPQGSDQVSHRLPVLSTSFPLSHQNVAPEHLRGKSEQF